MKTLATGLAFMVVATLAGCGNSCVSVCEPACYPVAPASVHIMDSAPPGSPAAPGETTMTVTEKDLLHHRFALKTIDGKTLSPEIEIDPYIEFNEGFNVSGRTCNQFRGKGELKDGVLTIGQMASTMMFCAFGELNELEKMFSAMMKEGAAITLADNVLTLSQGGHVLVYELRDLVN